ncbi:reverse transcriptase domain-containing protein [Cryobacterium serini]|uniref:Reverse transcriptase n=1 Tax=Cryobacterium serini TaxID=1259201 RepID=A0A4R9BUB8_9MICO|nr:reverse transcriptase domain-containing protein [Cryobacterium serini]TFD91233.1 Reverse transcriptase [Cryobacterium serini]
MSWTLADMGKAYRKAKVDLYYTTSPSMLAIADYEVALESNLRRLLDKINGTATDWVEEVDFFGGYTYLPTSVKDIIQAEGEEELKLSAPRAVWGQTLDRMSAQKPPRRPTAEFRLTAKCSLDLHVLSTLWMMKVGHKFDRCLKPSAYGNRLRRQSDGEVNELSLGSFSPYMAPFRAWRDKGLAAMTEALSDEKKVIAITADVSSFYHELNPDFMLDTAFVSGVLGLELSANEEKLNFLFINAITAWAASTPLEQGLPVGLPASALIANMALIELDRMMEREVVPLYYGRYVDDIMLVMENGAGFTTPAELWDWLFSRSGTRLSRAAGESPGVQYSAPYLENSCILFANAKNKIFLLEGVSGRVLVDSIERQVQERASEWRSLPSLPQQASDVATEMVAATQSDGEIADNLRKTDSLTMRRAGFALQLRDLEAYERDLEPEVWRDHRLAFYGAFVEHVLVLPNFFELATYITRVIRLATACKDFVQLAEMIVAINSLVDRVSDDCNVCVKSKNVDDIPGSDVVNSWKYHLTLSLYESLGSAFPSALSPSEKIRWEAIIALPEMRALSLQGIGETALQTQHARFFMHDLAYSPLRFAFLPKELVSQRGLVRGQTETIGDPVALLTEPVWRGLQAVMRWIDLLPEAIPIGLAFPTRPFSLAELFVVVRDPFAPESRKALSDAMLSLRGFSLISKLPYLESCTNPSLRVQSALPAKTKRIALGSWKTADESWTASVVKCVDPDADRYRRLNTLINEAISQSGGIDYLILPELALPAKWFMRIAHKLQARRISLIAGIEYLHAGEHGIRNQVWAALAHDGLGFPSMMIYRQDKQQLALHEEQELHRLGGLKLHSSSAEQPLTVIHHGGFSFAILVCSELTNINHRARLRGQIDALFVPEWNRDTTTFEALVESAALDIHAFIIQCNDRQYGDSRIRAPYRDAWKRDIVKIKGGVRDYIVTGDINVESLRQFQSSHRSADGPFKPMPDGFQIAAERKILPVRD